MESCVGKGGTRKKTWTMHNRCIRYYRHTSRWNGHSRPSESIAHHHLPSGSHRIFIFRELTGTGEILGVCENIWSHLWLSWEKVGSWRVGAVTGNVGGILSALICTWIHGKVDSRWKHVEHWFWREIHSSMGNYNMTRVWVQYDLSMDDIMYVAWPLKCNIGYIASHWNWFSSTAVMTSMHALCLWMSSISMNMC